ncbi:uncharacterized protein E0L32_004278 [Thyridium curvatum]|uniref:DNL-type domain-containing protein n=1 Tax=Thyridium curvatum TaxID=1093900 RepID=A0A507BGA3_9PEZI|nr:uncharacterized protein E0L32_004278 [Thyridium curvatum]TPX15580.1 hypothetical protein E0L32_004278 [Thyridium curvatum]
MAARNPSIFLSCLAKRAAHLSAPSRTAAPLHSARLHHPLRRISTPSPIITTRRLAHTIPKPPPPRQESQATAADGTPDSSSSSATTPDGKPTKLSSEEDATREPEEQQEQQERSYYELTFTCVPCGVRSGHHVSKQGYHHGSVLITCPSCRNRHIISDHLGIFGDHRGLTVEDLMRDKGMLVKKGTLGEDGDIEFWEDGTTTSRDERRSAEDVRSHTPDPNAPRADAAPGSSWTKAAGR